MTATWDTCEKCHQPLPPPPAEPCATDMGGTPCGHPKTGHHNTKAENRGNWTYCCHIGPGGQCKCQRFTPQREEAA